MWSVSNNIQVLYFLLTLKQNGCWSNIRTNVLYDDLENRNNSKKTQQGVSYVSAKLFGKLNTNLSVCFFGWKYQLLRAKLEKLYQLPRLS